MNRSFDMTYGGERLRVISSWIGLLSKHWDHHDALAACWDEALLSSDRAIESAQAFWGIEKDGSLPDGHWLLPCIVYYAPFIRACVIEGYYLPSSDTMTYAIQQYRDN